MSKKLDSLMQQVAEVAMERQDLEVKEKALKQALLEEMHATGVSKEETPMGRFSIKIYRKWSYSDKLVEAENKIKVKKLDEQRQGIATAEVSESVTFTSKKEK